MPPGCFCDMKVPELDIKLLKIQEDHERTHFYRWEMMRYSSTPIDVNLSTSFSYRAGGHMVRLILSARYTTLRDQMSHRLMDYSVISDFELLGPDAEADPDEIIITTDLIKMMLGVAIGAMRGMIALRTAHTFLAHYPLPVYDLETLMKPVINAASEVRSESTMSD